MLNSSIVSYRMKNEDALGIANGVVWSDDDVPAARNKELVTDKHFSIRLGDRQQSSCEDRPSKLQ